MALTNCKECGKEVSAGAETCPHCGFKSSGTGAFTWLVAIVLGLSVVYLIAQMSSKILIPDNLSWRSETSAATARGCTAKLITIKSLNVSFVDACRTRSCPSMKGVAVLNNGCDEAVGVQVKMVALDSSGAPVAASDLWPASVSNIPPGDYTFSVDHYIEYDERIKSFTLAPISITRWPER